MSDDIVELAVTFFDQVNDAVFLRELRCGCSST